MVVIKLILVITLILVLIDDIRTRMISTWHVAMIGICLVIPALHAHGVDEVVARSLYNLMFVGVQLAIIAVLLILRRGLKHTNLLRYIGAGDILFFSVISIGLAPSRFMLFYITGLSLSIAAFLVLRWLNPAHHKTVPTAGILSAYLASWQVAEICGIVGKFHNELLV